MGYKSTSECNEGVKRKERAMIMSMTGYGRGTGKSARRTVTVELKSLNSKQLDLQTRMPSVMREYEVEMRNRIASRMERGKVELSVNEEIAGGDTGCRIDAEVIAQYKSQIEEVSRRCGLPEPADWYSVLLRLPDALKQQAEEFSEDDTRVMFDALQEALDAIETFRLAEGKKLYNFFVGKVEALFGLLEEVVKFEEERVPKIKARLIEQLERLDSIEYDKGRLEQEMIFYIEKLDVTEEKTRLRSHLNYFMETLGGEDDLKERGQGKKLGFIAQEMGREINTLGSKSNNADMQKVVVRMKDELEQIKEQVLNVL